LYSQKRIHPGEHEVIIGSLPPFFTLFNSSVPSSKIVRSAEKFEYSDVRGLEGVKEASVVLPIDGKDTEVKVAVAHGTANAAKVLDAVKRGEKEYHFIEVMACPGGCVHGGGQSHVSAKKRLDVNPKAKRADVLYELDRSLPLRKSHKNPEVIKLYEEFLKEPNGHISHKYLHTHYYKRTPYELAQEEEFEKLMENLK
jgi:NADP-reducing hydrogenase subunit HndD